MLDEGRSKNRYLHTISSNFVDYVLKYLRNNPLIIQQNNFSFKPNKFLTKEQKKALPKLKDVTLFFVKESNVKNLIKIPEAGYYTRDTEDTVAGSDYDFVRGEITIKVVIDEKIQSFEELTSRYSYLSSTLADMFRHEVQHYVDDQALEGGLESQEKERSPYRFLTDEQKEEFNYFARPYEIKAYIRQFMEEAKRIRKPFYKVLIRYLRTNNKLLWDNLNKEE